MATERRRHLLRRGQALAELAVGMVVVSLVLGSLLAFAGYIVRSLDAHRTMRAEAGRSALSRTGGDGTYSSVVRHETLQVSPLAADYIFGSTSVEITDEVHLPVTGIQQF